jgi:hypothetical protein
MDDRTRILISFSFLITVLLAAGCGYSTQQSRFQMSFLPPSPPAAAGSDSPELNPPPVGVPNPYLQQLPGNLLAAPQPPRHKLMADGKVRRADEALNRARDLISREEDNPDARAWRDRAFHHIAEAHHAIRHAIDIWR